MVLLLRGQSLVTIILFSLTTPTVSAKFDNPALQCSALSILLPNKVSYPNSSTYFNTTQSYWFQQARLAPACIVKPTSTLDVAVIVGALNVVHKVTPGNSLFAIKSGGHTPINGSANDNGGVTIDLTLMDSLKVNQKKTVTSVGAGSIWSNIYAQLDLQNLTVSGGRVAGIGVGGLLTGGKSCYQPKTTT